VPARFCQISCQILAERFFQSNKGFPPFFPGRRSGLLLGFGGEVFPVKRNLLSLVSGGAGAFSDLLPDLTEKVPSQIFTPF